MIHWLIMVAFSMANLDCAKYTCASSGALSSGVCIGTASNVYYVSPCTDYKESYCPAVFGSVNISCIVPPTITAFAYPGEKCTQASDCRYGSCINNICYAQDLFSNCRVTEECNPGLRCDGLNKCDKLLPEGFVNCNTDYDCEENMGCDDGYCTRYFSVKNGDWIQNCTNNTSVLCESGQCLFGQCIEGFKSYRSPPIVCGDEGDCYSNDLVDEGYIPTTECKCGYGTKGQAICGLFAGDKEMIEYIKVTKEWIKMNKSIKCNTSRRWSRWCMISHGSTSMANKFGYVSFKAQNYFEVQGAEQCVLQIAFPGYYAAYDSLYGFSMWQAIGALILIII